MQLSRKIIVWCVQANGEIKPKKKEQTIPKKENICYSQTGSK